MKYISFCSGIEAATVAWETLGWEPLAFCEIDKFPSRVLKHHYPGVPNLGDFTAVDWSQWAGKADVCVGGTPCQAFSVAGLRKSLSDERGNLSLEFIRAINIIRPQYVVWENVPGVLSTADNAFGCFLAGLVGCEELIVFEQGWPDAGVVDGPMRTACWRVLDAQYFGLAQRRRRVFVVASAGDGPHPAEILFEWESLRRDSAPRREAGEGVARGIEIGPSGGSFTDINPTLDARAKDGPIRNQLAGAVAMCLNGGGMMRNDAESETLLPCIGVDEEQNAAEELMGCLKARREGGGQEAFVAQPRIPLELRNAMRDPEKHDQQNRQGCGVGDDGDPAPTLTKEFVHGVATGFYPTGGSRGVSATQEVSPPVKVGSGLGIPSPPAVHAGMAVRRLTPVECERLQGFPDNYTNIPGAADGPRYKALGNSMAVQVMRWIGQRIKGANHV